MLFPCIRRKSLSKGAIIKVSLFTTHWLSLLLHVCLSIVSSVEVASEPSALVVVGSVCVAGVASALD